MENIIKKLLQKILQPLKLNHHDDIAYLITTYVGGGVEERQKILEEESLDKKLYKVLEMLQGKIEIGKAEERITRSIQEKFTKHQKEIY